MRTCERSSLLTFAGSVIYISSNDASLLRYRFDVNFPIPPEKFKENSNES